MTWYVTADRDGEVTVLHVDPDAEAAREVAAALADVTDGIAVDIETSASAARDRIAAANDSSTGADGPSGHDGSTVRDRSTSVDCVVVAHGEFDGLGFLRTVRETRSRSGSGSDLPVVVLADDVDTATDSGEDDTVDPGTALAAGATEFCRRADALAHPSLLATRIEHAVGPAPGRVREWREKANQLDAVFSELPLSLYIKDEDARHVRVSRGHATGYDGSTPPEPVEDERIDEPSDFVGKTDLDLLPEANAREPYEDDLRVIETGEPIYNKEEHIERVDGEDLWVTTTKVPWRDEDGDVQGLIGFSLDITERKQYERTLERQTEELELLNRLLRHDVAHEVSAVNKRALLLKRTVTDADARDDLDEIVRSGERVAELLDTVRTLMGTMLGDEVALEPVPLGPTLRTELDRARSRHDEAVVEGPDSFPDVAVAANEVLREVFRNVLTNAVYHNDTPRPTVTVDVEASGETVVVRVADDGPGIPDDQKPAVFGRGESGLESPGTGIGLYLVDTIVETYGGDVWVEDNDPRGAVVCVRLPKADGGT